MRLLAIALVLLIPLLKCEQAPFTTPREKIAIIGSGASGSSASYYLNRYTNDEQFEITIFESSNHVGGRSITLQKLTGCGEDVELGASVFIEKNLILMDAVKRFNLTLQKFDINDKNSSLGSEFGIWDGVRFVYRSDSKWETLKFYLRYWRQFVILKKLLKKVIQDQFLRFFYKNEFPFQSLNEISDHSGLTELTNLTGSEYFQSNGLDVTFINEFLSSLTRINYSQDISMIHSLGALVTVAAAFGDVKQVKGGNFQIFENFIKESQAILRLNSKVDEIVKLSNDSNNGYQVIVGEEIYEFDQVILATPIHQGIKFTNTINPQDYHKQYVNLNVYIIGSEKFVKPDHFKTNTVPNLITTVFEPRFFSINLIDYHQDKYIYKIFTSDGEFPIGDYFESFELIHHQFWESYPFLNKTDSISNTFEIDKGLWYLNLMESFISTMETECLVGANIAALISNGVNTTQLVIP